MSYHHHLHHRYQHRARHPDLEFDRFFSADPSMPFSVSRYRSHDYDDMDFSSPRMIEDRMYVYYFFFLFIFFSIIVSLFK